MFSGSSESVLLQYLKARDFQSEGRYGHTGEVWLVELLLPFKPEGWSLTCIITKIVWASSGCHWSDETPQRWFCTTPLNILHLTIYIQNMLEKQHMLIFKPSGAVLDPHTETLQTLFLDGRFFFFFHATNNHKHQNLLDDPSHAV